MAASALHTVLGRRAGVLRLVLNLVFRLIPLGEMKNVVLVCRLWREVGEAPGFWAWVIITATKENMSTMPERLGCRRTRAVREFRVESRWEGHFGPFAAQVSGEVLKAMARHPGLRVVVMSGVDLSLMDPGLLASLVTRLEEVEIDRTELTRHQVEAIITAILAEGCLVKKLDISCNNLSVVGPSLLASAVNSIKEVNISNTELTAQQMEAIMTILDSGGCPTKKLDISWNNLSTVDPNLLARVVTGLEEMKWVEVRGEVELTVIQVEAILTAICAEDCLVKKLDISYTNLSSVDPGLLARAVNRLEEVEMSVAYLTTSQVEAVLRQNLVQTSLRKLKLELDSEENSELDEGLEARARLAIGELDIYDPL